MERLTEKHIEHLRFIGRVDFVGPQHLMSRFGISRATAYRHLALLREHELIRRVPELPLPREIHLATNNGLRFAGLPLREWTPSIYGSVHSLTCTEVVAALEQVGLTCITEREIFAHQRLHKDDRYQVKLLWTQRQSRTHRPDIAIPLGKNGDFIAIEVELVPKARDRWFDILSSFSTRLDSGYVQGVLYITAPGVSQKMLTVIAEQARLGPRFKVVSLGDPEIFPALKSLATAAGEARQARAA